MLRFELPFVKMPEEFVTLLRSNLSANSSSSAVFDVIRPNRAVYSVLAEAFKEFDDGRGLEKVMTALGWGSFRDRLGSVYLYKAIHGDWPSQTDLELISEVKAFEGRFAEHGVHGYSRLFLLGFYLKLASLKLQESKNNQFLEIKIPEDVDSVLKLGLGRSEKIDWLILITAHLTSSLGVKTVINSLVSGKKFEDLYSLMPTEARTLMHQNLLAYATSINEQDVFLYEKV